MDQVILPRPTPGLEPATLTYLTGEDSIQLTVFNAAAGVTVSLTGRHLGIKLRPEEDDPLVKSFRMDLVPSTSRAASTRTQQLGQGWLLDGAVRVTAGAPLIGQCYAIVSLVRGTAGALQDETVLAQGYLTQNMRLPISGNRFQDFLDGGGALRSIVGTTPGAGANISETVPTGARWELLAFEVVLVTAVAVANRIVELTIDDGVNLYFADCANVNQAASLTYGYIFAQGNNRIAAPFVGAIPCCVPSNVRLGAGHRIRTSTIALQAADQFAAPNYLVREWIEGA